MSADEKFLIPPPFMVIGPIFLENCVGVSESKKRTEYDVKTLLEIVMLSVTGRTKSFTKK